MSSHWHDSASALFSRNPGLVGRVLRELLATDLPPVIQYTPLAPPCGDEQPDPGMVVLAGPAEDPVRAVVLEFQQGRDDDARRRWPLHAAATWLSHRCPVDLLVMCPDELTAHWADRPVGTALDGYVCRPHVLLLEDLGPILT